MTFLFRPPFIVFGFYAALLSSCLFESKGTQISGQRNFELKCSDSVLYKVIGDEFGYRWNMLFSDSIAINYIDFGSFQVEEAQTERGTEFCVRDSISCRSFSLGENDGGYAFRYFQSLEREMVDESVDERTWKFWHVDDTTSYWLIEVELSETTSWPMFGFLRGIPNKIIGARGLRTFTYERKTDRKVTSLDSNECPRDSLQLELFFPPSHFVGDNIQVVGQVSEQTGNDNLPLDNLVIDFASNGQPVEIEVAVDSGRYEYFLPLDHKYVVRYGADGFVSKSVEIDARYVSIEGRRSGFLMDMDFSLFREIPGVDFSILDQPIGKCWYRRETETIEFDFDYTRQIQDSVNVLKELKTH